MYNLHRTLYSITNVPSVAAIAILHCVLLFVIGLKKDLIYMFQPLTVFLIISGLWRKFKTLTLYCKKCITFIVR